MWCESIKHGFVWELGKATSLSTPTKKYSYAQKKARPKPSKNYHKAINRYARKHLRVSRQRKEYCKRLAYSVIQSTDLNVKGLARNRKLAKSISDAGWSTFRSWLEYFGVKYGKVTVAAEPRYTSQECSNWGQWVKKTLWERTHNVFALWVCSRPWC